MPDVTVVNLKQKAALWAFAGHDKHGQVKVSAAVEISVRWQQTDSESSSVGETTENNSIQVDVAQAVALGSIMREGLLTAIPDPPDNLYRVVSCSTTQDLKGRHPKYTLSLAKHSSLLPPIV